MRWSLAHSGFPVQWMLALAAGMWGRFCRCGEWSLRCITSSTFATSIPIIIAIRHLIFTIAISKANTVSDGTTMKSEDCNTAMAMATVTAVMAMSMVRFGHFSFEILYLSFFIKSVINNGKCLKYYTILTVTQVP